MRVVIKTIDHHNQRYPTAGDWLFDDDGTLHIKVSTLGDERQEFLVAVHELIEAMLCKFAKIDQVAVDYFDQQFEERRAADDDSEPGDQKNSPYHREHSIAAGIERLLAAYLGVYWLAYEEKIGEL